MNLENIPLSMFLILGLASFRLTRLIVFDKITEFIRNPFFTEIEETNEEGSIEIYLTPKEKGIKRWIGELLSCYWCTGIWVSLGLTFLFYYYSSVGGFIILLLAVAAIGSIIEVVISKLLGD